MKTHNLTGTLFLLYLGVASLASQAVTVNDFIGIRWGTPMAEAKKIALSNRHLKFEKQEDGVLGTISLRGGSYLGKPASWWLLRFVNNKLSNAFVDFQLNRDQRPLWQIRQVRKMLVAKYGEPFIDSDSHPNSNPSWEECMVVRPFFKCDWKLTTSGPNPEATTVRLFLHAPTMESACMRLVLGQDSLCAERDKIEHDLKSGAAPPPSAEDQQAKETAVKAAFEKLHAAVKAVNGKLALEMRSKESLRQMTESGRAFWLRMRPNPAYAPEVQSVSVRSKTAGVYYTVRDSHGATNYCLDCYLLEDGEWKIHLTRVENHPPTDLARAFWLPADTAPFIESGEDWSKIEIASAGDPDWSVQATSDSVFLYIRFTYAADLAPPGTPLANDARLSTMVYTPGVSIGAVGLREGIRLSVGEVMGTRTAKPKSQHFANYSLTFRRKGDESYSVFADSSAGVLRILGRWIDIRIPRELLTDIPLKPLRLWVAPRAPATAREYTVNEWLRRAPTSRRIAPLFASIIATPAVPTLPDPLAEGKQAMRDFAARVVGGDPKAFDELLDAAKKLYQGIDYTRDRERLTSNFTFMHAAYDLIGEQAGKGNARAFEALKRSLDVRPLSSAAPDALGIAAALGHTESLQILLHHDKYGILKTSAVFALQAPALKNNAQAIAFLLAVLDNPKERALWFGAAQGLAAARNNPKIRAALEKYEKVNQKPAEPPR